MPLNPTDMQAAEAIQHAAAHDLASVVRLVAGPGTGKSKAIEERVHWILDQGVSPEAIYVVSFTRASALELRDHVYKYCRDKGYSTASEISVTTLHSLALRVLRRANLLHAYPAEPKILDKWELETIFDAEFGATHSIKSKPRCEEIRLEHEAFWNTGLWGHPNYVVPTTRITAAERAKFNAFHGPRTQCYSCVLPGEIVQKCVIEMDAGTLNAVDLLGIEHLVVDEFQDLNPMDLRFVDLVIRQGAKVFVAGDDDQSIYSFRYATPAGIQDLPTTHPGCGQHELRACFRCTPNVLMAGLALLAANPQPNRITKHHISLYQTAIPPLSGVVHRWRFLSGIAEARSVAESCHDLIASGLAPRDILILLSNSPELLPILEKELQGVGIPYEAPGAESFLDTEAGRIVLSLLRIVNDTNDYVAHRVLLGLRYGVGVGTCNSIANSVIANYLNYQQIFYQQLPTGVFRGNALRALNETRVLCTQIQSWQLDDTLGQHSADITTIVTNMLNAAAAQDWQTYANNLPSGMTLKELLDFLWADTVEQESEILNTVYLRLNVPIPGSAVLPPKVRVMTMHGVKGLSAKVVFVPGLEAAVLPGPRRRPYPGLVLEAARLLYVSITRARAACIVSYALTRVVNAQFQRRTVSPFAAHLGGQFLAQQSGLNATEVQNIMREVTQL